MTAVIPAPFTSVNPSPNRSPRQPVPRRGVVLHHAVLRSLDELLRLMGGAKQVSATCGCKDDLLPLTVPNDSDRPWSLSDAYWDSALRSVEACNFTMGPDYLVSEASHWTLARAVAYWAQQDGFWPHRDGDPKTWTVIGHREVYSIHGGSYATACPGGLDLDLVVRLAQQLLRGETVVPEPVREEDEMKVVVVDREGTDKARRGQWAVIQGQTFTRFDKGEYLSALADSEGMTRDAFEAKAGRMSGRGFELLEELHALVSAQMGAVVAAQVVAQLGEKLSGVNAAAVEAAVVEALKKNPVTVTFPPLQISSTVTAKS